jgi:hypothetical protein
LRSFLYAGQELNKPCQNAAIFALFGKSSFEVRPVRLHSSLPKIIKNIDVLVACKSDGGFSD